MSDLKDKVGIVDDVKTKIIIDCEILEQDSGLNIVDKVGGAFRLLQARRRIKVNSLDISLAAAEHYMYARFLAGVTGDPMVNYAPMAYGIKKKVYIALGIEKKMQTTQLPVLPPSDKVEWWGKEGAKKGLADYEEVNNKKASNYGKALRVLSKEAYR